jgi:hypothetical protein
MVKYLFPNYLTDSQEYEQAEALWRERWDDLVRRLGQEWLWESPWLNTTFADGSPCRDGNPIFSAVSLVRRLGVRVIQIGPSDNPRELYAWTDTFAKGSPESIKELVISCVLTAQTLLEAVDLMKRWIIEEEVELSWEDEYLGRVPVTQSTSPRRLELAVA